MQILSVVTIGAATLLANSNNLPMFWAMIVVGLILTAWGNVALNAKTPQPAP